MEEAVLLLERSTRRDVARAFRRERDRIYEVADPESREAQFRALHARWFERFGLQATVEATVNEHAGFAGRVSGGRIVRAIARSEEGADLLDAAPRERADFGPLLVLRLRPESLLEPEALQSFLRRELMHVADMLNPAFGYERTLPPSDDGPSADNIVRDRYRAVWDVTIDGRLAQAGCRSAEAREMRWREFSAAFRMLGDQCRATFERWWNETNPTHAGLVALATAPACTGGRAADRCPVCRFPVASLDDRVSTLAAPLLVAIQAEHPSWRLEQGLCAQCFDLYEARCRYTTQARVSQGLCDRPMTTKPSFSARIARG